MSLTTSWATARRHPSEHARFSLPNAIYFLLKFRQDLAAFEHRSLKGRMELYFWWRFLGRRDYPDFDWVLTEEDVAFARHLDPVTLISAYPRCVAYWLGGTSDDVLDEAALRPLLLQDRYVIGPTSATIPRFLGMLIDSRSDLRQHMDLGTFAGQLAALTWWETHGQCEYPRLAWSTRDAWARLNELTEDDGSELFPVPRFLSLLVDSRPDLRSTMDLSTFSGRLAALLWWDGHGQHEYPRLHWLTDSTWRSLNQPADANLDPAFMVPRFLPPLLEGRPDLRSALDLSTFAGRLGALMWWDADGRREYPRLIWRTSPVFDWLNELVTPELSEIGPVPRFVAALVASRPDLYQHFDLNSFAGWLDVLHWWDRHGRHEYRGLCWPVHGTWDSLSQPAREQPDPVFALPRFLAPLIASRPDLRAQLSLSSFADRLAVLAWWDTSGRKEYPRLVWRTSTVFGWLNEMVPSDANAAFLLPRFLEPLIETRPDLHGYRQHDRLSALLALLDWWQNYGKHEYPGLEWSTSDTWDRLATMDAAADSAAATVPTFLRQVHQDRFDLREAFDLRHNGGVEGLLHWWETAGRNEYPTLAHLSSIAASRGRAASHVVRERVRPLGVNVVGFPQGVLGLGEDARMAGRVLQQAGIDVVLVNAPMSGPARIDTSVTSMLSAELKYSASLFCLPPPEMVRLALEGGRRMIETDTYRIGAWPWELPHWPSAFGSTHRFVHEVWAQSRFVEAVYARLGGPKVHRMPMAVTLPLPRKPERERFGLSIDRFLFYLMFDGNSWLSRKNPVAGVRAFQQAFAHGQKSVGLVIKAMNVHDDNPIWREIVEIAAADDRITIVSERMDRQDTVDFMACCDAYISLHRSEGFGRIIAEAMLLGQPVVVTNFSGNVDFCDAETAYLVDGELVPLKPGEYLFHEGQYWCNPDIDMAADQLKRLLDDSAERNHIAQAGKARIVNNYSIEEVARSYRARLRHIFGGDAL